MVSQNIFFTASRTVLIDLLWEIVYFPLWWYTAGLKQIVLLRIKNVKDMADHLALRLLILNIFKPMFAQYDRTGRIISFFMRIIILVARFVFFSVYILLELVIVAVWIGIPIFTLYRIIAIYGVSYAIR